MDIYKKHAEELVKKGAAYYCFCSKERLDNLRKEQQSKGAPVTKYDKHCLILSKEEVTEKTASGESHVIRLNVPKNKDITFTDEVFGEITVNSDAMDDQVLLKSDGFPSYHLAVVVDDHLMEVTHVMRGNDWIPSTPKHVLLYEAFGWELPTYAHLPNLKEKGGNKKLSKRFGPVSAISFLEEGYLSEALLNFLMFLGWNPGTEKEIYSLEEFIKDFSIEKIHKTDLVAFDRDKLLWTNGHYIREMNLDDLYARIISWRDKFNVELPEGFLDETKGKEVLALIQERLKKFDEIPELTSYFFEKPEVDKKLLISFTKDEDRTKEILSNFISILDKLDDWSVEKLEEVSTSLLKEKEYKPKEAYMTLRVAISGVTATPPIFETLEFIGKEEVLDRLFEIQV